MIEQEKNYTDVTINTYIGLLYALSSIHIRNIQLHNYKMKNYYFSKNLRKFDEE